MADKRYTLQIDTKIKGDLEQGLKNISRSTKKAVSGAEKLSQSFNKINPRPIRDMQKAADEFGKSMSKLKPRALNDMSAGAKRLATSMNKIKPKALNDMNKSAEKLSVSISKIKPKAFQDLAKHSVNVSKAFNKIKAKPFTLVGKAAYKLKDTISKIKPKPFDVVTKAAIKMRKSFDEVSDSPFKKLVAATAKLRTNISQIKDTPFKALGVTIERTNSRVLNFIKNVTLMGYNLQGVILLAVNRLKAAFVDMTDQLNRVIGQMEKWTGSLNKAVAAAGQLQRISVETGWDLDALSSTFTKLGLGFENLQLGTDKLMQLTRGLGLLFRQVGADGAQMAKIAGQIATMFTRDTVPFEKIETFLGRGRFEQILKDLAEQLLKIKGIDLSQWGARTQNAIAMIKQMMDDGAISGRDLAQAWIKLLEEGSKLSTKASEIGHGFDQLTNSVIVFISRADQSVGLSNTLAATFTAMADAVLFLADNVDYLLKLGLVAALGFMTTSLPQILVALKAIGALIAGWASKFVGVKTVVTALIAAVVAFSKELNDAFDKFDEKTGDSLSVVKELVRFIVRSIGLIGKLADKILGIKEKPKDPESQTLDDVRKLKGSPSQIHAPQTQEQIRKEAEKQRKSEDAIIDRMEKLYKERVSVDDAVYADLPGTDVKAGHEDMKRIYGALLKLPREFGTEFKKSARLQEKFKYYEGQLSRINREDPTSPKMKPAQFLTGVRGELQRIMDEHEGLMNARRLGWVEEEDFQKKVQALIIRRKDAVAKGFDELQTRGKVGGPRHKSAIIKLKNDLEAMQKPFEKVVLTPVQKAIKELNDQQREVNRAFGRGDVSVEAFEREQVGIHTRGTEIQRKFTDELTVGSPDADKLASGLRATLGGIMDEAAAYLPIAPDIFSGFSDQLNNLKFALQEGEIGMEEFREGAYNVGKGVRETIKANFADISDDPVLKSFGDSLKKETQDAVNYFKPLNTGVRNLGKGLGNLMHSQKRGYLVGEQLAESYVSLNQQARDFRAANAKQLERNPKLLRQLNHVIEKTDGWAEKLAEVPEPKKTEEKFASFLGFGPAEGETDPEKIAKGVAERQQAGAILKQGATQGIDRVFDEGTQGRDFGPAGDIGKDFAKNMITMGPALATLTAAIQVITEIFVQAADMANFFGQGLQAIFDPLNQLMTAIADGLSPAFDALGSVFELIGGIIGGIVNAIKPLFKLLKAFLKPISAVFAVLRVVGAMFSRIGSVIGDIIEFALKPIIWWYEKLAAAIISVINYVIRAINALKIFGTYQEVSLEGKRHVPEEELEKEKEKEAPKDDTDNKQRARIIAELEMLRRINEDMEKEMRIQAQAAREVVRVKEIGSITEARQRGIISQEQSANEAQPLNVRVIATLDPREVDRHMMSADGQRAQMTNIRMNRDEIREMTA